MKRIKTIKTKAVIFDMDGVITNTMPDHYRSWKIVLDKEGIPVSHYDIYSREGQTGTQAVKELFEKYNQNFTLKRLQHILKEKENVFREIVQTRYILGSRSLLKQLKREGFLLGLVTGTSRHELHKILPDNIYNIFSVTITANDVTHGKPHPEPYKMALKALNIRPKDAIVIENAPFGIRSAKSARIKCVALETSLAKKYLSKADMVFTSIKEMQNKLTLIPAN